MGVRWNVEIIRQENSMSCWYASACMVAKFRGFDLSHSQALRLFKKRNKGFRAAMFGTIAQETGFAKVPHANATTWTETLLERVLRLNGPLWAAGRFAPSGGLHVIVITGVDKTKVYYNDPSNIRPMWGTYAWFNKNLNPTTPFCLMYKPKNAPPATPV